MRLYAHAPRDGPPHPQAGILTRLAAYALFICHLYLSRVRMPGVRSGRKDWIEGVTIEIVILAMIAAFLGLRLYSVLGRRAEHEEETIQGRFDAPRAGGGAPLTPGVRPAAEAQVLQRQRELPSTPPSVERGLRAIAAADRRFDGFAFLEGARSAYRMVLEAFWRGDKEELRQLCDDDTYDSFVAAIDAREAAGETLDNRLVRIEDVTIARASYEAPVARITLRFRADIAAVTRNADGQVIAGSLDDAIEAIDVWSFSRSVDSADPDWILDETDEG
jgi:predicted lipid-binding transport protein (Tim44 family)